MSFTTQVVLQELSGGATRGSLLLLNEKKFGRMFHFMVWSGGGRKRSSCTIWKDKRLKNEIITFFFDITKEGEVQISIERWNTEIPISITEGNLALNLVYLCATTETQGIENGTTKTKVLVAEFKDALHEHVLSNICFL